MFYKLAKSRRHIELRGFNEGKTLIGMERDQHRGAHPILTAMRAEDARGFALRPARAGAGRGWRDGRPHSPAGLPSETAGGAKSGLTWVRGCGRIGFGLGGSNSAGRVQPCQG